MKKVYQMSVVKSEKSNGYVAYTRINGFDKERRNKSKNEAIQFLKRDIQKAYVRGRDAVIKVNDLTHGK